MSPVVESVEVGRVKNFRVIHHDGAGRSRDVTARARVTSRNRHATISAGEARGVSAGTTMLKATYEGLTAHAILHVYENPIRPLSNRWHTEHGGACYLSVSPSSITMTTGSTRKGFVVTYHPEGGRPVTVTPARVLACQPGKVRFSDGAALAVAPGPAALDFVYRVHAGEGTDLHAICFVTVLGS